MYVHLSGLGVFASCVAFGSVFDAVKTYLVFMMGLSDDEVRAYLYRVAL